MRPTWPYGEAIGEVGAGRFRPWPSLNLGAAQSQTIGQGTQQTQLFARYSEPRPSENASGLPPGPPIQFQLIPLYQKCYFHQHRAGSQPFRPPE